MSARSVSHHVRVGDSPELRDVLGLVAASGTRIAPSDAWTSLFPPTHGPLDAAALSSLVNAPVVTVFFGEDSGVTLHVAQDGPR